MNSKTAMVLSIVGAVALILLVGTLAFYAGRGCQPDAAPLIYGTEIDAGPGEARLSALMDAETVRAQEALKNLETIYARDLATFDDAQRERYEVLRQDPEKASEFILEFNRRMRTQNKDASSFRPVRRQ